MLDSGIDVETVVDYEQIFETPEDFAFESEIQMPGKQGPTLRMIDFETFKHFQRFPLYSELAARNSIRSVTDLDRKSSLFIYISHRWLSASSGSTKKRSRPDDDNHRKYKLCVEGIERARKYFAPMFDCCYIWMDVCCINSASAFEDKRWLSLDVLMKHIDFTFTPSFELDRLDNATFSARIEHYGQLSWHTGTEAYLNRSWCRLEMLYSSYIPISPDTDADKKRTNKFDLSVAGLVKEGKRPHLIYGEFHSQSELPPTILPPIHIAFWKSHHPLHGTLSVPTDIKIIERLVEELNPYLTFVKGFHPDDGESAPEWTGTGLLKLADGINYTGDYSNGKPHGQGEISFVNGDLLYGTFVEGKVCGFGTFQQEDGAYNYEGQFELGKKHGRGVLRSLDFDSGLTIVYEGQFELGKKHGKGVLRFSDGSCYDGDFQNDIKQGWGTFSFADGMVHVGEYRDDEINGGGMCKYPNGNTYEGGFKSGRRSGSGILKYAAGHQYDGEFFEGKKWGQGTMTFANGDVYIGQFENNKKHGRGAMTFANGDVYIGQFENNKKHGRGVVRSANGSEYNGEFHQDMKHGDGIMRFANGDIYVGKYERDKPNGIGTMNYANGTVHTGAFLKGIRHGLGKTFFPNGNIFDGNYKHNVIEGLGVMTLSNGDTYRGEFLNGEMNGSGSFTRTDGLAYEGEFLDDCMHGSGILSFPSGAHYEGGFQEGMMHGDDCLFKNEVGDLYEGSFRFVMREGEGCCQFADGSTYIGLFHRDLMHGNGEYTYANGAVYTGEFVDNKKHGEGKLQFADGHCYTGSFVQDAMHGSGILVMSNGDSFDGDFVAGKMHGYGTLIYAAGDIYTGDFQNNQRHGHGINKTADGTVYEGSYNEGDLDGSGVIRFHNGDVYEGQVKRNMRSGRGVTRFADRSVHEGEYLDDTMHGLGVLVYPNGDSYIGDFCHGCKHGVGCYTALDGSTYEGSYRNNNMEGRGVLRNADGSTYEGVFRNNIPVEDFDYTPHTAETRESWRTILQPGSRSPASKFGDRAGQGDSTKSFGSGSVKESPSYRMAPSTPGKLRYEGFFSPLQTCPTPTPQAVVLASLKEETEIFADQQLSPIHSVAKDTPPGGLGKGSDLFGPYGQSPNASDMKSRVSGGISGGIAFSTLKAGELHVADHYESYNSSGLRLESEYPDLPAIGSETDSSCDYQAGSEASDAHSDASSDINSDAHSDVSSEVNSDTSAEDDEGGWSMLPLSAEEIERRQPRGNKEVASDCADRASKNGASEPPCDNAKSHELNESGEFHSLHLNRLGKVRTQPHASKKA